MAVLLSLAIVLAAPEPPAPRAVVGDELPAGAVARLGPQAFRYAGAVNVLHFTGTQTVWYSPDGKRVGVTSSAGVWVWDAATGKRLVVVPAEPNRPAALLGFHPAGDAVVTTWGQYDDTAGVYRVDPATGKVRRVLWTGEKRWFIAAAPDGKVVFSRAGDNEFTAETVANDLDTGKELWRKKHPMMSWMKPSADGSRLVTWPARADSGFEVLDAATGKTVRTFAHPDGATPTWTGGGIAVGPKAERVLVAHSWENGLSVFEAGREKPTARVGGAWYENVFLSADGKTAVAVRGRNGDAVEVWDAAATKVRSAVTREVGRTLALSPDGTTLATVSARPHSGTVQFFDAATGKPTPASPEPSTRPAAVWYLPDGTLASADDKFEKPVAWDVKTGAATPLPAGTRPPAAPKPGPAFKPPAGTSEVVVAPGGKRVLGHRFDPDETDSVPGDTYLGLFDATGRVVAQLRRPDETHGANYQFAPDGRTFVVARGDGTITLFDSDAGKELRTFRHAAWAWSPAFSPDGRYLATASGDGPILVWDLAAKPKP